MKTLNISTVFAKVSCVAVSLVALMVSSVSYAGALGPIERISEDSNGNYGDNTSYSSLNNANHFSEDRRYVVFSSDANNLVDGDVAYADIFVYDRELETIELVSRASSEDGVLGAPGLGFSYSPSISADGRYVAFYSGANNLVDGDVAYADIFVYDRELETIELVSRASSEDGELGEKGNRGSVYPSISADGRYVAFQSGANNLVDGDVGNHDIFVYDRDEDTIELVSANEDGEQGSAGGHTPIISPDGSAVLFSSYSTNFVDDDVDDPQQYQQVFVKQLSIGVAPVANAGSDQIV
ncbi:TolB family protein [Vibrio chemaguriensis]